MIRATTLNKHIVMAFCSKSQGQFATRTHFQFRQDWYEHTTESSTGCCIPSNLLTFTKVRDNVTLYEQVGLLGPSSKPRMLQPHFYDSRHINLSW